MFDVHARSFAIVGILSSISSYLTAICKQHNATRCKDVFGTTVFVEHLVLRASKSTSQSVTALSLSPSSLSPSLTPPLHTIHDASPLRNSRETPPTSPRAKEHKIPPPRGDSYGDRPVRSGRSPPRAPRSIARASLDAPCTRSPRPPSSARIARPRRRPRSIPPIPPRYGA